ncbi:hypothetical protein ACFO3O_03630 [Dokdonia ponticola]|uniref:RHS repeat protein n=1 Tax=Dokdonia ponticola TaxID=2041041 RepID=A0ABV9HU30_9FLAO
MSRIFLFFIFVFSFFTSVYAQQSIDPDYLKENIPASPEAGNLGTYGDIGTNPYNGKANISIPIHQINFEGLSIPIQLSYDSGGIRVNSESSWVGMNWSLSANAAITRDIQGNDDLNEGDIPNDQGTISAFVYNIDTVVQDPPGGTPSVSIGDIIEVHATYGNGTSPTAPKTYADTQPDIFNVSVFGKSYTFRFNKRNGISTTLTTHIFNNNHAQIDYDLITQTFTLLDDRGFEYVFSTKDYAATVSSTRSSNGNGSSDTKEFTLSGLAEDHNPEGDNTIITSWLLDRITSPTGQQLFFSYQEGAHFTHPSYSGRIVFRESNTHSGNDEYGEDYDESLVTYTSSMSLINSNYLSSISGDFGEVNFTSIEDRRDLLTGSDVGAIFPSTPLNDTNFVVWTKTSSGIHRVDYTHGTPSNNHFQPTGRRLSSIDIKDYNSNTVRTATFDHGYYNDQVLGNSDEAKNLRLKLNGISILDQQYEFEYENPNGLPEKGTFDTDFWGFYNGANNITNVPSIGRFGTQEISNQSYQIGQTYFDFDGGSRKAEFSFGNRGNLIKIVYPTGGYSEFQYESNKALVNGPAPYVVTDYFPNGTMRWTNLTNEDNYRFTYQYLKNAQSPNYDFFSYRYDASTTTQTSPLNFTNQSQIIVNNGIGIVNGQGNLYRFTGIDNFEQFYDVPKYYVQDNNNPSNIYPLFYYGDWQNSNVGTPAQDSPPGNGTVVIPPGDYILIRQQNTDPGMPGVQLFPEDFTLSTQIPNTTDPNLPQFIEGFAVGGSRIKTITNRNNDGKFISKKQFDYKLPNVDSQDLSSSGKLMDELIFHTKFTGFFSYTPSRPGYGGGVDGITITSNSNLRGNPSAQGSHIGYSFVREYQLDKDDVLLSITDRSFSNEPNQYHKKSFEHIFYWNPTYSANQTRYVQAQNAIMLGMNPKNSYEASNGNLLTESLYDCSENLLRTTQNEYESIFINNDLQYYANFNSLPYVPEEGEGVYPVWMENGDTYITFRQPLTYSRLSVPTFSQTIDYLSNGQTYTDQYSTYDGNGNLVATESIVRDGESTVSTYYYPYDSEVASVPGVSNLVAEKQFSQVVKSEAFYNDQKLGSVLLNFADNTSTGNNVRVTASKSAKANDNLETKVNYEYYDNDGNLLQSRQEDGTPMSYIWGYNKEYIIAKVQNITYTDLANLTTITTLQSQSNSDTSSCLGNANCNEQTLRNSLETLRNALPENVYMTSYTYDPLVGVTSITDPRGSSMYYIYDANNRLSEVYDQDYKLISKNEYNITNDLISTLGEDAIGITECGSTVPEETDPDPNPDNPDGPLIIVGSRMADNTIQKDGQSYPALSNSIDLIDTQTSTSNVTLHYQAFPYGGSGNLMYRWKLKGETFSAYSSSPTWTKVFDCSSQDPRGIEVICEVKDMTLGITERDRLQHLVLCND